MNLLIVFFSGILLSAPQNVIEQLKIQKTSSSTVLKVKLRKNYLPKTDAWWLRGELRFRIRNSRFSTVLNFKNLKNKYTDFEITGHYIDDKGAVLKIKFKNTEPKPDFTISHKLGMVLFSVKSNISNVATQKQSLNESKTNPKEKTDDTNLQKTLINKAPKVSPDKLLNNKPQIINKTKSEQNKTTSTSLPTKQNKTLGEDVRKSLKNSQYQKSSTGGGGWFNTFAVVIFLGLLGGIAYFIIKQQKNKPFDESSKIEIVAQKQITKEHRIVVVKFGGRILVLGLTSGSVSLLTEFITSLVENSDLENEDKDDNDNNPQFDESPKSTPESVEGILKLKKQKGKSDSDSFKISQMEDAVSQAAFLKELKKKL